MRRLSYSNVMATFALFVALGGSSYAAVTITGKQVKNESLTSKDVKNRSLLAKDFKRGQLKGGSRGATGPAGARGPAGANGGGSTAPTHFTLITSYPTNTSVAPSPSGQFNCPARDAFEHCTGAWLNYGDPHGPVGYGRDGFGFVHLQGVAREVVDSTEESDDIAPDTTILTLPPGYRPGKRAIFTAVRGMPGGPPVSVRLDVRADGTVRLPSDPSFEDLYLSFEGITFRCGPSGSAGCP
jgi:hypothetical protein